MISSVVAPSFSAPGNAVVRNQNGSPALPRWPALGQVLFQFLQELRATLSRQ